MHWADLFSKCGKRFFTACTLVVVRKSRCVYICIEIDKKEMTGELFPYTQAGYDLCPTHRWVCRK